MPLHVALLSVVGFTGCLDVFRGRNDSPDIVPIDDVTILVGQPFQQTLDATDPNRRDELTYQLQSGPEDIVVAGEELLWLPDIEDLGVHTVVIRVQDDGEPPLSDETAFLVTVVEELPLEESGLPPLASDLSVRVYDIDNPISPAPAGLCIELRDVAPVLDGLAPTVLATEVTVDGRPTQFDEITPDAALGVVVWVEDCDPKLRTRVPSATFIPPDAFRTEEANVRAYSLSDRTLAVIDKNASAAGLLTSLQSTGFLMGFTPDLGGYARPGGRGADLGRS